MVGKAGDAAITVSTSTRVYSKQDIIIFDDTFAHSVKNSGTTPRTVLSIDIWHPQLTLPTRQQLSGAFPPRGDDVCRARVHLVHQLKQLPSSVLVGYKSLTLLVDAMYTCKQNYTNAKTLTDIVHTYRHYFTYSLTRSLTHSLTHAQLIDTYR